MRWNTTRCIKLAIAAHKGKTTNRKFTFVHELKAVEHIIAAVATRLPNTRHSTSHAYLSNIEFFNYPHNETDANACRRVMTRFSLEIVSARSLL